MKLLIRAKDSYVELQQENLEDMDILMEFVRDNQVDQGKEQTWYSHRYIYHYRYQPGMLVLTQIKKKGGNGVRKITRYQYEQTVNQIQADAYERYGLEVGDNYDEGLHLAKRSILIFTAEEWDEHVKELEQIADSYARASAEVE